ncbi:MAG: hypothetical protein IKE31_02680 [Eubacterium sp.]|nr:hypothetical protein [Eubacterium sp.]
MKVQDKRYDRTRAGIAQAPVESLDLTAGTWRILKKNTVRTVQDLTALVHKKNWATLLLRCGRRSVWEIAASLSDRGLASKKSTLALSGYPDRLLADKKKNPRGMLLPSHRRRPEVPEASGASSAASASRP